MEKKHLFRLTKTICVVALCVNLTACANEENAYFEGQYLYVDGVKYVEASGLYEESNTVIARTENDYTIYEVVDDKLHNYIVVRSFLDQTLYVREDYTKDRTTIEGICFNKDTSEYICEQDFIDVFSKELLECDEKLEMDADTLMSLRKDGIGVYVKYADDNVGEYCGSIMIDDTEYMFYNAENDCTILISDEMEKNLTELSVLEK